MLREDKHPDDLVTHLGELQRMYRNLIADIIESGRQKGTIRTAARPELDAGLVISALHGILVQGFLGRSAPEHSPEQLDHLKATLVDTLRR
jgi:hypothetical protein